MSISRNLYRLARTYRTGYALARGPKTTARRAKNIVLGRLVGRLINPLYRWPR